MSRPAPSEWQEYTSPTGESIWAKFSHDFGGSVTFEINGQMYFFQKGHPIRNISPEAVLVSDPAVPPALSDTPDSQP